MAIIPQLKLFEWNEIQTLGDLDRLCLVLDYMPDEELMSKLERNRGKGRNDYPIRAMWNSVLAGRFPRRGFDKLVKQLSDLLADFGKHLAMDSKAISSFAKHKNKNEAPDGRRDADADYGKKKYSGVHEDGKPWDKIVKWFGYKLHLIVDATYELPVAFKVTKASASDITEGHELLKQMENRQPEMLKSAETLAADRGYDDTKLITKCWDEHQIKPVIDIRNMWRDPDKTRLLAGRENVVYDYKGTVSCVCPETGKHHREYPCGCSLHY